MAMKIGETLTAELTKEKKHEVVVKYFKKEECPKCRAYDDFIISLNKKYDVKVCMPDDPDGLSEISYHQVLSFPSLIIEVDGEAVDAWFGDLEREQIKEKLEVWD